MRDWPPMTGNDRLRVTELSHLDYVPNTMALGREENNYYENHQKVVKVGGIVRCFGTVHNPG